MLLVLPSGVNVAFHFIQLLVTEVIVVSPNFGHVDLNIGHMVPNSGHRAPNFGHSDLNIGHRVPHPPLPDIPLVVWIDAQDPGFSTGKWRLYLIISHN